MKIQTRWWGEVDVEYWRDPRNGDDGLRLKSAAPGPFDVLNKRDIVSTGEWDLLVDRALRECVEDNRFAYKPPAVPTKQERRK
jgi:hypothetical protein